MDSLGVDYCNELAGGKDHKPVTVSPLTRSSSGMSERMNALEKKKQLRSIPVEGIQTQLLSNQHSQGQS